VRKKTSFKCVCGHGEDRHNFDPDSAFFGCCEEFYIPIISAAASIVCPCTDYKADNLKYLEDLSEKKSAR
jgi:hypothetical protein